MSSRADRTKRLETELAAVWAHRVGVLVVEPDAVRGQVAERVVAGVELDADGPGAVAAGLQLVQAGFPAVERAHDADGSLRLVGGQAEGDPGLVAEQFAAFDHDVLHRAGHLCVQRAQRKLVTARRLRCAGCSPNYG